MLPWGFPADNTEVREAPGSAPRGKEPLEQRRLGRPCPHVEFGAGRGCGRVPCCAEPPQLAAFGQRPPEPGSHPGGVSGLRGGRARRREGSVSKTDRGPETAGSAPTEG